MNRESGGGIDRVSSVRVAHRVAVMPRNSPGARVYMYTRYSTATGIFPTRDAPRDRMFDRISSRRYSEMRMRAA